MPVKRNKGGDALSDLMLVTFRAYGAFLAAGDRISATSGLTAARWQVLGSVMRQDKTVSQIAREMGLARQSVQRLANVLAEEGYTCFVHNPAHQRAKLVSATPEGRTAMYALSEGQHIWANGISEGLDTEELSRCVAMMRDVVGRLERFDADRQKANPEPPKGSRHNNAPRRGHNS